MGTQLYAVYYNFTGWNCRPRELECITDDFDKFLEEHNKDRVADGNDPEGRDEFDVEAISPVIYNKG